MNRKMQYKNKNIRDKLQYIAFGSTDTCPTVCPLAARDIRVLLQEELSDYSGQSVKDLTVLLIRSMFFQNFFFWKLK
jgi:hypothetical protein